MNCAENPQPVSALYTRLHFASCRGNLRVLPSAGIDREWTCSRQWVDPAVLEGDPSSQALAQRPTVADPPSVERKATGLWKTLLSPSPLEPAQPSPATVPPLRR